MRAAALSLLLAGCAGGAGSAGGALVVEVEASQYAWKFRHPGGRADAALHLPAEREVELRLSSKDVIHALFIPDLKVREDAIPGRPTCVRFTTPGPRELKLVCAEYSGTGHANHTARVRVLSPNEFERWR